LLIRLHNPSTRAARRSSSLAGAIQRHLVGSTDRGDAFFFARNDAPESSDFTGPRFSPERKILFANVQSPGYVCGITDPFRKQRC